MSQNEIHQFSSRWREQLFLSFAKRPGGTTAQEVFDHAVSLGDQVTVEAYHNLARRLAHRTVVVADKSDRQTKYTISEDGEGKWLDEDQLSEIINPAYPLIALTILQEATRQVNQVPENVWFEIRERLMGVEARSLFIEAIIGYCDNLADEVDNYITCLSTAPEAPELPNLRQRIENQIALLKGLANFGLGLSIAGVQLPKNVAGAVEDRKSSPVRTWYDRKELAAEIERRVEEGPLIRVLSPVEPNSGLLIAAVDGSTRSGLTSPELENGDFSIGNYPMVTINTAVCQVNKSIRAKGKISPVFFRFPEKPEDMQQADNRNTIMAKVFFPDITDGEYIHSVWNAMDALESKASLRSLKRWYTGGSANTEVRPADILLRDGTVVPQERDFTHYIQQDSYGKIARDLIEANWEIVKKCKDDDHTVAGVVKTANLRVIGPVINWFVSRLPLIDAKSQIKSWPIGTLNLLTDQVLLSRLLSAQRQKGEAWNRTCVILRPFQAVTKSAQRYCKESGRTPADLILGRALRQLSPDDNDFGRDDSWLRGPDFRGEKDPYIQLLRGCWYAGCYVCSLPRLDLDNVLPRLEFILPIETAETGVFPKAEVAKHLGRLLSALKTIGFDVAAEHSMFRDTLKIDILPALLIQVHDTVKIWAAELVSRVNEYIGFLISKRVSTGVRSGIKVRPFSAKELKAWSDQLQRERDLQAGGGQIEKPSDLPPLES